MTIPRYQGGTVEDGPSTTRGGKRAPRARDGHDFLKADDLSTDPKTAKILAVRVQPDNFNPKVNVVMCKVTLDGHIKMWPIRLNNPNLEVLQNAFGTNENDWLDKKIQLSVEEDEFDGRHWIRAAIVGEKKKR